MRAARERRGITLTAIAAATKISASHLAALERNDLSRWPAGIYRRAWIRSYAAAVGLAPDATVGEFVVAFDPAPRPAHEPVAEADETAEAPLRLTLAPARASRWSSFAALRTRAVEVAIAVLLAILVAWVTDGGFWMAAAVLALCAYAPLVGLVRRAGTRRLRI